MLEAGEQQQVLAHAEPPVERRLLRDPGDTVSVTSPESGSAMPARIESSVVLPAPFGPISATTSPVPTSKSTP